MSERGYKYRLPEILAGHRQTANWLVGLSTGALAGLLSLINKVWPTEGFEAWSFALSGLLFVLAVCWGVAFHLFITAYTNCYEQHARADEERSNAQTACDAIPAGSDPQRLNDLQQLIRKSTEDRDDFEIQKKRQHKWFKLFYWLLTATFFSAVVTGCVFLVSMACEEKEPSTSGDVFLLDGRNSATADGKYSVLLLDTKKGLVYELWNDTNAGGTKWLLTHAHARTVHGGTPNEGPTEDTLSATAKQEKVQVHEIEADPSVTE